MEEKEQQVNKKKNNKFIRLLKILLPIVIKLVVIVVVFWVMFTYVFGIFRINDNNMYPMLKDGDLCIMYKLEDYYKNDVVVYTYNGENYLGRIIAQPGDVVDGDEEGLLVNGNHIVEEIFYTTDMSDVIFKMPRELGENEFFILNDYRLDETDSRTYGILNSENFNGKLLFFFRRRGF